MAQVAYEVKGLRRGNLDVGLAQMERWSLNQAPTWTASPLGHSRQPLQHQQPTFPKHAIQAHPLQLPRKARIIGCHTGLAIR